MIELIEIIDTTSPSIETRKNTKKVIDEDSLNTYRNAELTLLSIASMTFFEMFSARKKAREFFKDFRNLEI